MNRVSSEFKKQIRDWAQAYISENIDLLKSELAEVQNSANSDSKSSMGDKYETSHAMAMIEKENLVKQLENWQENLKVFLNTQRLGITDKVGLGSLVITDKGICYYLAAGLGRHAVEKREVFFISSASPIGQLLMGRSKGEKVNFNGQDLTIEELY